jgi:hypothetical protein
VRAVALAFALAGCAGPFEAIGGAQTKGEITVESCGASEVTPEGFLRSIDNPPVGESVSGGLPPARELTVCVRVDSKRSGALRIEPGRFRLKTPHEQSAWNATHADEERVLAAGESHKFSATFSYPPLSAGERVSVLFDDAARLDDKRISLPPLTLRKR